MAPAGSGSAQDRGPGRFALLSKLLLLAVVSSSPVWSKREQATCALRVSSRSTATATKRAAWQCIRARVLAVPESTAGGLAAVVITGATVEIATVITAGLTGLKVRAADHSHRMLPCHCQCHCLPTQQASVLLLKAHVTSQPCSPAATCMHVHRARERQQVAVGCIMHTCLTSRSH